MICPTKNDGSGISSAPDVGKNEEKAILVPAPKKRSVPPVFSREAWRRNKPSSTQKKEFARFAKAARQHFEDSKK